MAFQIHGEIHHIGKTEQKGDNFTVRNFILIIDQNTPYPQSIALQCANQKVELLDKVQVGDQVSVDFNLKGRLLKDDTTKAFINLDAWKIEKVNR